MQLKCIYKYLYTVPRNLKSIFVYLLVSLSIVSVAQCPETNPYCNAASNWIFGDSVWLTFRDTGIVQSIMSVEPGEVTSVISNSFKKLEMYAQPEGIYSKNGTIKLKTTGGNSSRQGALILKLDSNNFIGFSNDEGEKNGSKNLYVNIFDSLVNKQRDETILATDITEGLSAINHQNNYKIWLISHHRFSDTFFIFLLNPKGGLTCPVINSIGGNYQLGKTIKWLNGRFIKVSSDGKYLTSFGSESDQFGFERIDLFKFDSEGALLSSDIALNLEISLSASFSPDNSKLYIHNNRVFQFDLSLFNQTSVINSRVQVSPTWLNELSYSQLGPNGKIYFANGDSSYLGVINSPNKNGVDCGYFEKGFLLNNRKPNYGLPNFNQSIYYTPSIDFAYSEDCWGHSYSFEGRDTLRASSWKWHFKKDNHMDSILTKNCTYTFPDTGKWEVSHLASIGSRTDTVTKTLTIRPKWDTDMLGRDTFYCTGDSINLILKAPADMHCVHWNGEEPNLDESLGPIVDYDHFHSDTLAVDTAGVYIVKVTNKTFCQMWDTLRVTEIPKPSKSVISRNGNTLKSSIAASTYRWYFNGEIDTLTLQPFYLPTANGYWQVQLISEYGCESELSDSLNVGFATLENRYETLDFRLYPNPNDGHIFLEVPNEGKYRIQLSTIGGQLVSMPVRRGGSDSPQGELYRSENKQVTLNTKLTSGTYIITLTDEDGNTGSEKIEVVK